ncbi:MAG: hypothetical protein COA43_08015 [Robiginitomaculum sp.]|nr:MAG: hypothetical protein COA43_08015 [Robiginitomaculum sp.]
MKILSLTKTVCVLWVWFLLVSLFASGINAAAQDQSTDKMVRTLLVSDTSEVTPGNGFIAALRLDHSDGWHTYWKSPGIGDATTIKWSLPTGWIADDIDWPVPHKILLRDGKVSGHGFDGVSYLPVRMLVSADAKIGSEVILRAKVEFLVCEYDFCVPGTKNLKLSLFVSDNAVPNKEVRAELAEMPMPEAGENWTISAVHSGDNIVLSVKADEAITELHFFSHDELIWHTVAQNFEVHKNGLVATLPIDNYYEPELELFSGVLAFTDAKGNYRGVLINVPIEEAGTGVQNATPQNLISLLKLIAFAFLGGLILNLMPCVLPILSLKALSLAKSSGESARAARLDGFAYAFGVVLSFVLIAIVMLIIRASLGAVGWGFQLQQPAIVLGLALLMMLIGLNLLGVFEVQVSIQGTGQSLTTRKNSLVASFFTGVLAVVVAAPCTAPFMASAIGVALVQSAPIAIVIFAALGFGLAFPYLLLSIAPATRKILPKPGAWMDVLKQVLAFPMFATGIWLLWVLGGQTGKDGMTIGLLAVLFIGFAAWAYGKRGTVWKAVSLIGLAIAGFAIFSLVQIPPGAASDTGKRGTSTALFETVDYTPQALDDLLSQDTAVFAYFTADWCISCKVNERVAIKKQETATFFKEANITVMVGDWTSQDPAITKILTQYKRAGVPMYLYFKPGTKANQGVLLPQVLTPAILKKSIEKAS